MRRLQDRQSAAVEEAQLRPEFGQILWYHLVFVVGLAPVAARAARDSMLLGRPVPFVFRSFRGIAGRRVARM
jgi:hypothetical protein